MEQIFVVKYHSGEEENLPYRSLSYEQKNQWIKKYKEKKNFEIFCSCGYPDTKIKYSFSSDNKLYPKQHNAPHRCTCPAHYTMACLREKNSAFYQVDEDSLKIRANVRWRDLTRENFFVPDNPPKDGFAFRKSDEVANSCGISALMININWRVFEFLSHWAKIPVYLDADDFEAHVNSFFKNVYINEKTNMKEMGQAGKHIFFCSKYKGAVKNENDDNYTINVDNHFIRKNENEDKFYTDTFSYKYTINSKAFDYANDSFKKRYNGLEVMNAIERGYRIVAVGVLKRANPYRIVQEMHFLLVNKNGLFCESMNEVKFFDYLLTAINEKNMKADIVVFRPWEKGMSIYEDNRLEDGIIYIPKKHKRITIEIFGIQNDSYIEKKNRKIKELDSHLLSWDVQNPLPNLDFLFS